MNLNFVIGAESISVESMKIGSSITTNMFLLPGLIYGSCIAAMLPDSPASQGFLAFALTVGMFGISKVCLNSSVSIGFLLLLVASPVLVIAYIGCVAVAEHNLEVFLDTESLKIAARLLVMPLMFLFASCQDWTTRRVQNAVCIVGSILLVPMAIHHLVSNSLETGPVILDLHSNSMALAGMLSLFLAAMFRQSNGNPYFYTMLFLSGTLASIFSVSRTAYVCIAVAFVFGFLISLLQRQTVLLHLGFIASLFSAIWFTTQFGNFLKTPMANMINEHSESLLGKRLDSGRLQRWEEAFDQLKPVIWFGCGTNARENWTHEMKDGEILTLSVHNYYLAVMQETGVFGLSMIFGYLAMIWCYLASGTRYPIPKLGMTLMMALILHQINEVTLTTGNYQMSIAIWTTLGAMASFVPVFKSSTSKVNLDAYQYSDVRSLA